ncbi:hypothetical protein BU16DRAFT_612011 [Lophium mytilinum]|uniref:CmcJ-like methyltransferase n=1 Tax=Lophium mytilinum TaxID=390894 RepID=A0A6A6RCZ1_9PEZI|nr:hypothetical protein BU16DRAFT_612011 [Lophium mytilinum]
MPGAVPETDPQTSIYFLKRNDLYHDEKPYSLRFTPPNDFPRSNIVLEKHDVTIRDIRPRLKDLSFEKNGFTIMSLESKMSYDDYDDEEKLINVYLREVADSLCAFLGAVHVQIFEHTVRKRHDEFPISTGKPYRYNQPTSMAHVDTTPEWARDMVQKLNRDNADEVLKDRVQCVNVWKPLKGPVKDWPLAMCDPRSIKPETDLEPCDLVYPDYVVENRQLYYSPRHEWVYLSGQQPSEAWVFLQSDTTADVKSVPHTAFPNPLADKDAAPRESIEVRALVYYGGFDGE